MKTKTISGANNLLWKSHNYVSVYASIKDFITHVGVFHHETGVVHAKQHLKDYA